MLKYYEIISQDYDFSKVNFAPEIITELKKLTSDVKKAKVICDIEIDDKLANAIRRTAIGEYPIKCLEYPRLSLETNDVSVLRELIYDAISYIPVNQDCPETAEFKLEVLNEGSTVKQIYSGDLQCVIGDANKFLPKKIPIAILLPGSYINIPSIKIEEYERDFSKGSLTSDIVYEPLDYKNCEFLNYKGNFSMHMVKSQDLLKHVKVKDLLELRSKKILIVSEQAWLDSLEPALAARIKKAKFDAVIIADLEKCSSSMHYANRFLLEFNLIGHLEPKDFLISICDYLQSKFLEIEQGFKDLQNGKPTDKLEFYEEIAPDGDVVYCITLYDETHTTIEYLIKRLCIIQPDIKNIKNITPHYIMQKSTIEIIHSQAFKILATAARDGAEVMKKLIEDVKSYKK